MQAAVVVEPITSYEWLNYKRLARAVLESAMDDLRISRLCSRCGRKALKPDLGRARRERDKARAFIASDRLDLWCHAAGLSEHEFRNGARVLSRQYRKVCGCTMSSRMPECEDRCSL